MPKASQERHSTLWRLGHKLLSFLFNPWHLFIIAYFVIGCTLVIRHCYPGLRVMQQSQRQYWQRIPINSGRGIIQDSKGNALVISEPLTSLAVDPSLLSEEDVHKLDAILPSNMAVKLTDAINRHSRFMWLKRKMQPEEAKKTDIAQLGIKAVKLEPDQGRRYTNNNLLSHVLGFCDVDNRGLAGIEQTWDTTLYSPPGMRTVIRKSGIQPAIMNLDEKAEQRRVTPIITLTIDGRIQYVVEKHLFKAAEKNGAKWAAAVCIDPWTGAVLAMASWPSFDPKNRTGSAENYLNNVIGRMYEPGSTFKPIYLGMALEKGWARTNEIFHCPAKLKVADGFIKESYPRAMGDIDTAHLLIKSSNVGMAQIGMRAERTQTYENLRAFGFGSQTNIELPGVANGIVPYPEQWRGVVPANIAIGQGLAVTPLQLVTAAGAIVNGGRLMSPFIVKEAMNSIGEIVYKGRPNVVREVLTPETAKWLRQAMREVVVQGTGKRAATNITKLAGKTGTAQVPEKGKYSANRYVASFIGFWPYEDPKYLMLLVIGEPTSGLYYGGELACPPFKDIVEEMAELEYYAPEDQTNQPVTARKK